MKTVNQELLDLLIEETEDVLQELTSLLAEGLTGEQLEVQTQLEEEVAYRGDLLYALRELDAWRRAYPDRHMEPVYATQFGATSLQ